MTFVLIDPLDEFHEYEDYLWALKLEHKPVRPPRAGFIGECVYAEEWELLMKKPTRYGPHTPHARFADVLRNMRAWITQRHATVAASFVCWLGTNCGQSVILGGKRITESNAGMHGTDAYLAAWSTQNMRHVAVNHSVRTLEHLLAPEDHYGRELFTGAAVLTRFPELTVEDYETADHAAAWLGGEDGQAFIANCERRITELQAFEDKQRCLRHDQELRKLGLRS